MTLVREFHRVYGQDAPTHIPCPPDPAVVRLRMRLIKEEAKEVVDELTKLLNVTGTLETHAIMGLLLKELADLRYVTDGCAVAFGLDIDGAFRETHRSNMSKLGADGKPIYDAGGKVLKGPNYTPADMSQFVQVHEGDTD